MARRFLSAIKLLTGSTPPAGTAGDTFFDTDTKTIQVHDGSAWVNSTVRATDGAAGGRVFTGDTTPTAPVTGDLWVDSTGFSAGANIIRWRKTAVGAETSLSGLDDLSTTLSYTPGYEQVYINGALQVRSQDYVATTGTTLTGLAALVVGDVVEVISPSNMVYGDYYTQSQSDAKYSSSSFQTGNRNVIINGDMRIDQRNNGASIAIANSADYTYGPDRWFVSHQSTGAGGTFTRFSNGTGDTTYYTRITTTAGTVGLGKIGQRIEAENSRHLAGKTVTLSFYAAANTSVTWSVSYANTTDSFGTGSSPTVTSIATGTITVGSSFGSRYSATFAVPSAATTGIQVLFASQTINGYRIDISNVQLEAGSTATPFETRPIGTELALCQRYFQTSFNPGQVPAHGAAGNGIVYHSGVSGGISGNLYTHLKFSPMRTFPIVSIFNGNNASALPANGVLAGGLNTSASGIRCYVAGGAGLDSTNIGIDYIRLESVSLYAQGSFAGAVAGILAFGYSLNAEI